jgi:hypothetical protein
MACNRLMRGLGLAFTLAGLLSSGICRSVLAQAQAEEDDAPAATPREPLSGSPAAQPLAPPLAPAAATPATRWYGYQLMIPDAVCVTVLLVKWNDATLVLSELLFFMSPLVIHGMHRNGAMVIVSPLLRLVLPLGGALLGALSAGLDGVPTGFFAGAAVAMAVDYITAWEQVPPRAPLATSRPEPARSSSSVRLTTAGVVPLANGAALVLAGCF